MDTSSPKRLIVATYIEDDDGLPPDWLGQDVIAVNPEFCSALVAPRDNTTDWLEEAGMAWRAVEAEECPFVFGKCASVSYSPDDGGHFAVNKLRDPFGPTCLPGPYFGLGVNDGQHDFWGVSAYTPAGVRLTYQFSERIEDGSFFPSLEVREFELGTVEEARDYYRELLRKLQLQGEALGVALQGVVKL